MKSLDVIFKPQDIVMGRLHENKGKILFEFTDEFIGLGLNVSPFHLKLAQGIQTSSASFRHGLHGLFDDSLPDGWGLLLMDKNLRARGMKEPFTALDRLAYIGDNAMGALSYRPSLEQDDNGNELFDLQEVANHSVNVFEGIITDVLPILARAGGSPGGARPKVLVGIHGKQMISGECDLPDGFEHWLIKFAAKKDLKTAGVMEYSHYQMALDAGLNMMESRLFSVGEYQFFGTKRFDRINHKRIHVHTAGNLIDADFRSPSLDYESLIKLTRILTRNESDVLLMFRLMVFNVAIQNQDDHAKNFSFIMDDHGEWRLSPAYDLTRSIVPSNQHATSVNGKGAGISKNDMLAVADKSAINQSDALEIISHVFGVIDKNK